MDGHLIWINTWYSSVWAANKAQNLPDNVQSLLNPWFQPINFGIKPEMSTNWELTKQTTL